MTQLKIEYVPISQLKPFAGNPRKNDESVDAVIKSIEAFGYTNPILARRENNEIIAGHTRLKALQKMDRKQAPVIFLDLDEMDARVYSIFDNKSVENADWDFPKLADLLVEFDQLDVDLDLTGFSMDEIEDIAPATFGPPVRDDDDLIPESPPPVCKTGDLWILGNHRLLCGNCTLQANVERLMGGVKADMVFTDPPYNVQIDYGTIKDDLAQDEHERFSLGWFSIAEQLSKQVLFTPGTGRGLGMPNLQMWYRLKPPDWIIIWVKKNSVGHSSLGGFNNWEPIFFYGKKKKKLPQDIYDIPITVQQDVTDSKGKKLHPTPKQVKLWVAVIDDLSDKDDILYEPFCGSGTTIIACEKLNRRCYGMEIEPKYCDVIIKRWEDYTGGKAVLDDS